MFDSWKKNSVASLRSDNRIFVRRQRIERTLARNLLDGAVVSIQHLLFFFIFNFLLGMILIIALGAVLSYKSLVTRQFNNLTAIDDSIKYYTFLVTADTYVSLNNEDFSKIVEMMDQIIIERYFKKYLILVVDGESGVFSNQRLASETKFVESEDIQIMTINPKFDQKVCIEIADAINSTKTVILGQKDYAQKIIYLCNNIGAEFFYLDSKATLGGNIPFEEFLLIYLRYLFFPILR